MRGSHSLLPASGREGGAGNELPQAQDGRLSTDLAEYGDTQRRRGGWWISIVPQLHSSDVGSV